ncbi:hypothetical protein NQ317_005836 [Molorchus minor]|uniref:NFACT RNA-binding domain-containing protein n=1 Tax=Molorchus minor TaxID=1323400 RepID=A0ABQ9J2G7_9CUCU|nr:hypothetical protein NQ317_005836 [Molorchus minor]
MAICYSVAWEAKVVTNAYWVWGDQVSKTAPTGEYLTTGSFMIRGKEKFPTASHLILGFSFLFRLEEGSIEKHLDERKVLTAGEEDALSVRTDNAKEETNIEENIRRNDPIIEEQSENLQDDASDSDEDSKFPRHSYKNSAFYWVQDHPQEPSNRLESDSNDENIIYLGDGKPVILKTQKQNSRNRGNEWKNTPQNTQKEAAIDAKQQQSKRGQKSKLKKIKEKYKDQDEEERKLRMEILQSSGNKESKKIKGARMLTRAKVRNPNRRLLKIMAPKEPTEDGAVEDDEPTIQADET